MQRFASLALDGYHIQPMARKAQGLVFIQFVLTGMYKKPFDEIKTRRLLLVLWNAPIGRQRAQAPVQERLMGRKNIQGLHMFDYMGSKSCFG